MFSKLQDLIVANVPKSRYRAGRLEDALPEKVERDTESPAPLSNKKLQSTNVDDLTSSAAPPTVTLAPENDELETWSGAPDRYRLNPSA